MDLIMEEHQARPLPVPPRTPTRAPLSPRNGPESPRVIRKHFDPKTPSLTTWPLQNTTPLPSGEPQAQLLPAPPRTPTRAQLSPRNGPESPGDPHKCFDP